MVRKNNRDRILVVDDEWDSPILKTVIRTLEDDGWDTTVVKPTKLQDVGAEFESETLFATDN